MRFIGWGGRSLYYLFDGSLDSLSPLYIFIKLEEHAPMTDTCACSIMIVCRPRASPRPNSEGMRKESQCCQSDCNVPSSSLDSTQMSIRKSSDNNFVEVMC